MLHASSGRTQGLLLTKCIGKLECLWGCLVGDGVDAGVVGLGEGEDAWPPRLLLHSLSIATWNVAALFTAKMLRRWQELQHIAEQSHVVGLQESNNFPHLGL